MGATREILGSPIGSGAATPHDDCHLVPRSTFGPHAIGTERFPAVTSGTSFRRCDPGEHALVQNPDKDEAPGSSTRVEHVEDPRRTVGQPQWAPRDG